MKPLKSNIRAAIDDYFRETPDGLDVTAFVLDRLGRKDMEADARATHRSLKQANTDLGRLIASEFLPEMFSVVEPLASVKVDPTRWPALAEWVTSYTQHRIDRRRR
jgi:hypothetical protein